MCINIKGLKGKSSYFYINCTVTFNLSKITKQYVISGSKSVHMVQGSKVRELTLVCRARAAKAQTEACSLALYQ